MQYLLDTNIFIRSKNEMPMDIWLSFWNRFEEIVNSGNVFTINNVKDEINRGRDELTEWIGAHTSSTFCMSTENVEIMSKYQDLVTWANISNYT